MSEYQFYEWQTADRLLSDTEQEAVRQLADFQNAGNDFLKQATDLCARFRNRPGFLQRVREAKVLE